MFDVVDFARQILDMQYEINELRAENECMKKRLKESDDRAYRSVNDSINYGFDMINRLIKGEFNGVKIEVEK